MIGTEGKPDDLAKHVMDTHKKLKSNPQMLLFSATFADAALRFADSVIRGKGRKSADGSIKVTLIAPPGGDPLADLPLFQVSIDCGPSSNQEEKFQLKIAALQDILKTLGSDITKCIIFVKTKEDCRRINQHFSTLYPDNLTEFHGGIPTRGLSQEEQRREQDLFRQQRDQKFDSFCQGTLKYLIATDVLAKGIDVPTCSHIINFDVPEDHDTRKGDHVVYTHKIGRCIRFGRFGMTVNLLSGADDKRLYQHIEEGLGYTAGNARKLCQEWQRSQIASLKAEYETKKRIHEEKDTAGVVEVTANTTQGESVSNLMLQIYTGSDAK
jgi:superfamily II DNA/RNA helicase